MQTDETELVNFFRNLADSIEQKKLIPVQLKIAGEFFMKFLFQQQSIDDDNAELGLPDNSEEDFTKFITLGWYVYTCLLDNQDLVMR